MANHHFPSLPLKFELKVQAMLSYYLTVPTDFPLFFLQALEDVVHTLPYIPGCRLPFCSHYDNTTCVPLSDMEHRSAHIQHLHHRDESPKFRERYHLARQR